jgi:hypothetical protein
MNKKDMEIREDKREQRKLAHEKKIRDKHLLAQRTRIYEDMVSAQKINKKKVKHAPQDAYISLQHINKIYDNKVQAVYDFSLDIKQHEFIVFVGPSGCGKSTTLRMIAGLEDITYGDLFIDKTYANELHPKDRDIAMVFQSYALYPHMTVSGNIAFGLKIKKVPTQVFDKEGKPVLGINKKAIKILKSQAKDLEKYLAVCQDQVEKDEIQKDLEELQSKIAYLEHHEVELFRYKHLPKSEIRERVLGAAKLLQIEDYLDRKPKALSGGQCQRVALGRAIVKNAKVFLMDEPLSNLDAKLRVAMRSEIIKLHNSLNATTIYVTHDQTEAMTMASRIVVMNKGHIQQIGTPIEIYNHPANMFVATFIGSPAMNLLKATYQDGTITFQQGGSILLDRSYQEAVKRFYVDELAKTKVAFEEFEKNFVERNAILDKIHTLEEKLESDQSKNKDAIMQQLEEQRHQLVLCEESSSIRTDLLKTIEKLSAVDLNGKIDLVFGIRPEDIYQTNRILTDGPVSNPFRLKVAVAELLGHEYFVHSEFGESEIISKIHAKTLVNSGDELDLVFDLEKVHLFDSTTQKLIK